MNLTTNELVNTQYWLVADSSVISINWTLRFATIRFLLCYIISLHRRIYINSNALLNIIWFNIYLTKIVDNLIPKTTFTAPNRFSTRYESMTYIGLFSSSTIKPLLILHCYYQYYFSAMSMTWIPENNSQPRYWLFVRCGYLSSWPSKKNYCCRISSNC